MSDVKNYQEECLFCNIIQGSIPSTRVYEDELCFAFRDIAPQAPTHILVIPKTHIASANDLTEDTAALAAHLLGVIPQIAQAEGLTGGYRIVSNVGDDAGQSVKHLHFHILGGKRLSDQMA
jgi:histidine triad (HIT) family protein